MIRAINHEIASSLKPNCLSSCRYYGFYEEKDELVGVVGIRFRAWYCSEICHLLVASPHRCQGIGTALVAHAIKKVRTPLAVATVRTNNKISKRIFLKLGFKEVKTFTNPNTGNKVVLMVRTV